jgi:NAD(P)-dependent dehydrogenase (short-subunit alcohol dehydrogenase family)
MVRSASIGRFGSGANASAALGAWTASDIPDQRGRVAVITGANAGVGLATARELSGHGAHVVLAVRDIGKGAVAAAAIRSQTPGAEVSLQQLDLASLASIHTCADELRDKLGRIDLLINNAGVMAGKRPRSVTTDGFELHFGTNHLGHFALTGLLLQQLLITPHSRIVTVSSAAHRLRRRIDFEDLHGLHTYNTRSAYAQSKLANLMFSYELQRRLAARGTGTLSVAAHPGGTRSGLARDSTIPVKLFNALLLQEPAMGALPTLRAATDTDVCGGEFFGPRGFLEARGYPKAVQSSSSSRDLQAQHRLWSISEELTGVHYPI